MQRDEQIAEITQQEDEFAVVCQHIEKEDVILWLPELLRADSYQSRVLRTDICHSRVFERVEIFQPRAVSVMILQPRV